MYVCMSACFRIERRDTHPPSLCLSSRAAAPMDGWTFVRYAEGGRELWQGPCSQCNATCIVPFKPSSGSRHQSGPKCKACRPKATRAPASSSSPRSVSGRIRVWIPSIGLWIVVLDRRKPDAAGSITYSTPSTKPRPRPKPKSTPPSYGSGPGSVAAFLARVRIQSDESSSSSSPASSALASIRASREWWPRVEFKGVDPQ